MRHLHAKDASSMIPAEHAVQVALQNSPWTALEDSRELDLAQERED
jgi:hypothetical protein